MDKERKLKAVANYVTFYDGGLKIIPTEEVINAYNKDRFALGGVLECVWYIYVRKPSDKAVQKGLTMIYRTCYGQFGMPTDEEESGYDPTASSLYLERNMGEESMMDAWINMDETMKNLQENKRLIEENWNASQN